MRRAAAWSERLGWTAIGIGLLVFIGWAAGIEALKSVIAGFPPVKPNAALGLILNGIALVLSQESRPGPKARRWAAACATAALVLGGLTSFEYLAHADLGIDQLLFRDTDAQSGLPGRMYPIAAAFFILEGAALFLLARDRARRLSEALGMAAGAMALLVLIGYLYSYKGLYQTSGYGTIALAAAAGFFALSLGQLLARPSIGVDGLLTSSGPGGLLIRRLLPAGIIAPIVFGWLRLEGERLGLYSHVFGTALLVFSLILVIGVLIIRTAATLDGLDRERSQAERDSRQLAAIVQSSSDAIIGKTLTGIVTSWNPGAQRLYGYKAEEVVGQSISLLIPLDHQDEVPDILKRIKQGEWIEHYETVRKRKDGNLLHIALTVSPIKDSSGAIIGASAISRDITDKKAAEERFRLVVEAAPNAMAMVGGNGKITLINAQTEKLFGYVRDELLGQPIELLIPERFRLKHPGQRDSFFGAPEARAMGAGRDLYGLRKDGSEVPVEIGLNPIRTSEGPFVLASIIDISERKKSEQALRAQAELLDLANDAIFVHALDGRIAFWNRGAERLYGWGRDQAVGRISHDMLGTAFSSPLSDIQAEVIRSGRWEGELTHTRRDGGVLTVLSRWALRRDEGGRPSGFLEINTDLTSQKAAEEERSKTRDLEGENRRIVEGSRLKSEFLANMSHELRTPLNGIIGFSELLHDGKAGKVDEQQKEFLGDILNSARHLLQLINDVLDLSKVESGKMEFRYENVLPEKVIGEVRDVLRTLVAQKRIKLESSVHPGAARVVADSSKLKQILYNYISNALKFTPDGGQVSVRVSPQGDDRFRLEVEDTGIGIAPEDQKRLFVEFQQLDSTMAKKHAGTGLGLALTKRIVEAQGGQVGVQSSVGKGSVFFAVLPKMPRSPAHETADSRSGASTVLVVDDNDADRAWLVNKLTSSGYAVEVVVNGEQAISRCRERRFSAVLLDLLLPDMNGWEVFKAIRGANLNKATPVIVVTIVADKNAGAAYPIQDYLLKPVSIETLRGALERAGITPQMGHGPILVVDDDPKALRIMREHLDELGYRSILAESGAAAFKAADIEAPSAVILDLMMPEMDGFEFLEKFRASAGGSRTPVIIWTSKDLTREEASRLKLTTQALLRKEGSSQELAEQLRKLLPLSAAKSNEVKKERGG
jgi:PAS domain S-box-containing protein